MLGECLLEQPAGESSGVVVLGIATRCRLIVPWLATRGKDRSWTSVARLDGLAFGSPFAEHRDYFLQLHTPDLQGVEFNSEREWEGQLKDLLNKRFKLGEPISDAAINFIYFERLAKFMGAWSDR